MSTSINNVTGLQYDKTRNKWGFRWVETDETGESKRRASFRWVNRDKAEQARRKKADLPLVDRPIEPANLGNTTDTDASWAKERAWYRDQLRAAMEAGDRGTVDLCKSAVQAFTALSGDRRGSLDVRKLKKELERLEQWRKDMTRAATHGTRIGTSGTSGGADKRTLRSEDAIH